MQDKETAMIELTEQQVKALENAEETPLRLVKARTKEAYVLLPLDEYNRSREEGYDDTPWTREELQTLAWDAGKHVGWEEVDDCDDAQEKR
jgi:hypothetical protein